MANAMTSSGAMRDGMLPSAADARRQVRRIWPHRRNGCLTETGCGKDSAAIIQLLVWVGPVMPAK
jgi:hypothetical protein